MTDIRRHLPAMLSCIREHISAPSDRALLLEHVRAALAGLLPHSYGIGTGRLVQDGQHSLPLDVIIYDKTIPASEPLADGGLYDLRRALVVMMLDYQFAPDELDSALHVIASAKLLRPQTQSGSAQGRGKTGAGLKKLLPIGVVACQRLAGVQVDEQETLGIVLDTALKRQKEAVRADYLIAQVHQLSYSSPLLERGVFEPTTISITREPALSRQRRCYVCKQTFTHRHFFYTQLCVRCGDYNYQKRTLTTSLAGRTALVTGARIKIGYATALHLLRAGASVIATTRFPCDAARRYSSEPDAAVWRERLHICGLDLRHLPALEEFIVHLYSNYRALDLLINNAAQTVKRPAAYYAPLLTQEQAPLSELPVGQQQLLEPFQSMPSPRLLSEQGTESSLVQTLALQGPEARDWPALEKREDERPDLPNSWTQCIDEIDLTELLEVQVINVTAPFLLISRLRGLMGKSKFTQRFIINVSAVEGQFAQAKAGTHPHTNMAKAALNMLTHSVAADLARDGIFLNSVDPGYVSRQHPLSADATGEEQEQPLDMIDAAARICDPIMMGIRTGQAEYGNFYKDYRCTAW